MLSFCISQVSSMMDLALEQSFSSYLPGNFTSMMAPLILLLIVWKLWYMYNVNTKDHDCKTPLPPGSMGLPIVGETLQYILKVNAFSCCTF